MLLGIEYSSSAATNNIESPIPSPHCSINLHYNLQYKSLKVLTVLVAQVKQVTKKAIKTLRNKFHFRKIQTVFQAWHLWASKQGEKSQKVNNFVADSREKLRKDMWLRWRSFVLIMRKEKENRDKAVTYYLERRLSTVFQAWRKYVSLCQLELQQHYAISARREHYAVKEMFQYPTIDHSKYPCLL
jgi:hypothetical protein